MKQKQIKLSGKKTQRQISSALIKSVSKMPKKRLKRPQGGSLIVTEKIVPPFTSRNVKMPGMKIQAQNNNGDIAITDVEFITDLITTKLGSSDTTGFVNAEIPVNPGLNSIFNKLSGLAQNYSTYNFLKLQLVFVPSGSSLVAGNVFLAGDSDPNFAIPTNKKDMTAHTGVQSNNAYHPVKYDAPPKLFQTKKTFFTRYTSQKTQDLDLKLYDCMKMMYAYEGCPKGITLGQIYISYTVELKVVRVDSSLKQLSNIETFGLSSKGTISVQNPLGSLVTAADAIGKFVSVGLNMATGGASGLFFSTAKNVLKMINMGIGAITGAPDTYGLDLSVPKEVINDNTSIRVHDFDVRDTLDDVSNGNNGNSYIDITSTNIVTTQNYVVSGNGRIMQWLVKWPAGAVLAIKNRSGSNIPSTVAINVVDADVEALTNGVLTDFF